jgi:hypothetical protein
MIRSTKRVFVRIGLATIVGIAVGCQSPPRTARPQANITLTDSPTSGRCEPSDPGAMSARHNDQVVWRVENRCRTDYSIKFDNFRLRGSGGTPGNRELVVTPDSPERLIPQGVTVPVPAQVRADAKYGTFKYDILLKGTAPTDQYQVRLDPDIDIWP